MGRFMEMTDQLLKTIHGNGRSYDDIKHEIGSNNEWICMDKQRRFKETFCGDISLVTCRRFWWWPKGWQLMKIGR